MGKDARIRGYFSKPKGVREQRSLGNTDLDEFHAAEGYAVNLSSATFRPAFVRPSIRPVCALSSAEKCTAHVQTCSERQLSGVFCFFLMQIRVCSLCYVHTQFAGLPHSTVEKPARD